MSAFSNYVHSTFLVIIFLSTFVTESAFAENITIPSQLLAPTLPALSGKKNITVDLLLSLPDNHENGSVHWLDHSHLVYGIPKKDNKEMLEIGTIDINTKNKKIVDFGLMPKPSPDGVWIAYIRKVGNEKQLWIIRSDGKEKKQLSKITHGLTGWTGYNYDFAWSPDSKQLVLCYQPDVEDWDRVRKGAENNKKSSAVSDENLLKPLPKTKVYHINITNAQVRLITSIDAKLRYISWFPNGKELLFLNEREAFRYNQEDDKTSIMKMNIADGAMQTLARVKGLQQSLQPVSSPKGNQVAFTYDPYNPYFSVVPNIGLVSSTSSPSVIQQLTHELKLFSPKWSPDGKLIYVRRNYGAYRQIYAVNVATGTVKQITNAPLNIESFDLSPEGTRLAWMGQD